MVVHQTTFTYETFKSASRFEANDMWKLYLEAEEAKKRIDEEGGKIGKINIALEWSNSNDLDLYVTDPIVGKTIYYGEKKCIECGAELDIDMNAGSKADPYHPVEHVYYDKVTPGKTYKIKVNFFSTRGNGGT
jgi:hypothetical protein